MAYETYYTDENVRLAAQDDRNDMKQAKLDLMAIFDRLRVKGYARISRGEDVIDFAETNCEQLLDEVLYSQWEETNKINYWEEYPTIESLRK